MKAKRLLASFLIVWSLVSCDDQHRVTLGSANGVYISGAKDESIARVSISPKAITLPRVAGEVESALIVTNREKIVFECDGDTEDWLSITVEDGNLSLKALSDNNTLVKRTGSITFIAGEDDDRASTEISVEQESYPWPELTLDKQEIVLEAEAGSAATVKVTTNQEKLDINMSEGMEEWCSAELASGVLNIAALSKNAKEGLRDGWVYLSSSFIKDSVQVKQKSSYVAYHLGDPYPKSSPHEGIIVSLGSDGSGGIIMSLDEKAKGIWSSSATKCGTNSTDGEENTRKIVEIATKEGTLNESGFAAVYWCVSKGEGWYLPAWKEFNTILTNCGLLTDAGVAAFNEKIAAAGGTLLATKATTPRYWSSSENSAGDKVVASYVTSAGAAAGTNYAKNATNGVTRCLKTVKF